MPSIEAIERSGLAAWSPDETTSIAGWTVSSNGGFTRRLNSATANGSADTSLSTRDAIASWLAGRGAPLTIRVTPLTEASTADACETTWELEPADRTVVMVRAPEVHQDHGVVTVVAPDDPRYTADLFDLNQRDPAKIASWNRIVERAGSRAVGMWVPGEAVGLAAVSEGICSVFSVAVHPHVRRTGLAKAVMDAASAWSIERGASWQFVQVLGTNTPAIELYEGLGFANRYEYSYLQSAPGHEIRG